MSVRVNIQQSFGTRVPRRGGALAILLAIVVAGGATALVSDAAVKARFERDVSRIVFNDNLELLQELRQHAGATEDSLLALLETPTDTEPTGAIIIFCCMHGGAHGGMPTRSASARRRWKRRKAGC